MGSLYEDLCTRRLCQRDSVMAFAISEVIGIFGDNLKLWGTQII